MALADLLNAHSREIHGTDAVTQVEIEHWFGIPTMNPEVDMRVAVGADGSLLGYADVNDGGPEKLRYWIDLRLPGTTGQEVGDALLAALEDRARETAAPAALARGFLAGHDEHERRVYQARGYELIRHSLRMEIRLEAEPPPEPVWPDGVAIRTARQDDARDVYAAVEEAFADHWEFQPTSYEEWAHWALGPDYDPELWFLAETGGELAAVCLCTPHEPGEPDLGWVASLGVRRPWRRRGVGLALLHHAFRVFHRRGLRRVGLGVDAENLTGAVRLYERAGMHVARRNDIYSREL